MQPSVASNLEHLSEFKPLSDASDNSQDTVDLCQGQVGSQNSKLVLSLSFPRAENTLHEALKALLLYKGRELLL